MKKEGLSFLGRLDLRGGVTAGYAAAECCVRSSRARLGSSEQSLCSLSALTPSHPMWRRGQLPQLTARAQPGFWLQQELNFFQVLPLELLWS